ncbi:MAG TPA: hypothetical protein EYN91_20250, partial [Candidatus Melainabacteria bacterium]|nr:hypothetical protein [Candidatus Melainabacteria bacterium]
MNSNRLAIASISLSLLLASANTSPAHAQFLKKLLQGNSQQNEFQTNQFGQPYQSGATGTGFGQNFFGGNQPYAGGQQFFGGNQQFGGGSANFSSNLNSLESSADQVSNRLQKFLQSTGRWAPQPRGNDMQCCVAMQAFKQQVGQLKRNAGGNVTPQFQMQLNQLQQSATNLVNSRQAAGIDPGTRGQAQMLRDNVSQMLA